MLMKNLQNKRTYFMLILQALLLVKKQAVPNQQFIRLFCAFILSTLQSPLTAKQVSNLQ